MVFLWLVKIRAGNGSAQNTQFLDGFFAKKELFALAGVDSIVPDGQKRDRGKTRSAPVVVGDFCSLRALLSNSFFTCLLEIGFLPFLTGSSTPAMLPVFLRSFAEHYI